MIDENLELVTADGYIQPLPEGGIRVHIHLAAARPSGEVVGGHCEEATTFTGAFMYLHVPGTGIECLTSRKDVSHEY